jgi:hypothetical protein
MDALDWDHLAIRAANYCSLESRAQVHLRVGKCFGRANRSSQKSHLTDRLGRNEPAPAPDMGAGLTRSDSALRSNLPRPFCVSPQPPGLLGGMGRVSLPISWIIVRAPPSSLLACHLRASSTAPLTNQSVIEVPFWSLCICGSNSLRTTVCQRCR